MNFKKLFKSFSLVRWLSLALIASGVLLLVFQLVVFSRLRTSFSNGSVVAGVDVSGLTMEEAANRLTQVYSVPVELRFNNSSFQVKPSTLGFTLDISNMLAAADQARASLPFWSAFWDYLFNIEPDSQEIPIRANINVDQLRSYLINEVAARYDQDPEPYSPIPGEAFFTAGKSGLNLDVDRSIELVSMALKSPANRTVNLSIKKTSSSRPSLENLKILLSQIIDNSSVGGTTEIYLLDLESGQEMQLAYRDGEFLVPDIAFSANSTIKIPIMVEVFREKSEPIDEDTYDLLKKMMTLSDNTASDLIMKSVMDPILGPLVVSDSMEELGLPNTVLLRLFEYNSTILRANNTPAKKRTDEVLDTDLFNQTTPAEIGSLLNDIYQCAQTGSGTFFVVFPGQISQAECRSMISLMLADRIGMLIETGLPDGTQIAHKHAWAQWSDLAIHEMADSGIIYSPGGNYILTIYVHNDMPIIFDQGNKLYGDLSRAVYNYFNLGSQ